MEIIIRGRRYRLPSISNQNLLAMKLTVFICTICLVQLSARTFSQTVSYSAKNANLVQIFHSIEKQTGYTFFYNDAELAKAKTVTLELKSAPLQSALEKVLQDQPFQYTIKGNTIFIKAKPIQPLPLGSGVSSPPNEIAAPPPANPDVTITVLNTDNQPLEGASVIIKGQNKGIATDINGRAILRAVDPNAAIIISFTGYINQEYKLASNPGLKSGGTNLSVHIHLAVSTSELDEMQVIAYGKVSKRLNVGNITTIKAEDISRQSVNNPLLAIEGRVPGLFITPANGLANSGVTVRIQGQTSISRGSDPLYVIDGVPFISQTLPTISDILGSSGNKAPNQIPAGSGNPLSYINPSDIESIDVLKDADATAIYGSRAANGAILITTKKGKVGQTKVDINFRNGWSKAPHFELLNTQQYLDMRREAKKNDNAAMLSTDYDINGVWDTTRNTDWQKVLIGNTAHYADANVNVSGGTATTQFLIGAGYHKESTIFPGDFSDQKNSLHFNINNRSVNQKFGLQLSGTYMLDNNQLPGLDLTAVALSLAPDAPSLYNTDGSLNWAPLTNGVSTWSNPLASLYQKYDVKNSNLIGNAVVSYKILPGLEVSSNFGYTSLNTDERKINPMVAVQPELRSTVQRAATFAHSSINTWIVEPQMNYQRIVANGQLETLIGGTFQRNSSDRFQITGSGQNSDQVLYDIKAAPTLSSGATIASEYKYSALFGRVRYNWRNKYLLNLTARRDGSSRFGSESQLHNFWSIGGGWIISKEPFIQNIKEAIINFAKLRGSYGTSGNDQIGDYQFLSLYSNIGGLVTVPYQGAVGLAPNSLPNPHLEWEETKKLQFGLDLGLFNDRILATVNYTDNRSSNQLLSYALPTVTGFSGIVKNFPATVQNTSWEFSINSSNIKTRNFEWRSSINFTLPRNKLVEFPDIATSSYADQLVIGQSVNLTKSYHFIGVDPATGLFMISDSHGNPTTTPDPQTDRTIILNTDPTFYGGFQNSMRYKNLEFDFFIHFTNKLGVNYFYGRQPGLFISTGANGGNQPVTVLDRWQKPGDIASIQRYSSSYAANVGTPYGNTVGYSSDAGVTNAAYLRLKNVSISWRIPEAWRKKIHVQDCRIYANGQNLLVLTKFPGPDPEVTGFGSLPPLKVFTMGIQVGL